MTRPAPPRASARHRIGYPIWLLVLLVHVAGVAAILWLANHPGTVLLHVTHPPGSALLTARWLGDSAPRPSSPHISMLESSPAALPVDVSLHPSTDVSPRPSARHAMDAKSGSKPKRKTLSELQRQRAERSIPVVKPQASASASVQHLPKASRSKGAVSQTKLANAVSSAAMPAAPLPDGASTLPGTRLETRAGPPVVNTEPGGPVITQARYRHPPVPVEYPPLARRRGIEGRVLVLVWLDEQGEQLKRQIIESSGSALLDQAALRSVARNQFLPHTLNGVGHAARLRLPVIFRLHP